MEIEVELLKFGGIKMGRMQEKKGQKFQGDLAKK